MSGSLVSGPAAGAAGWLEPRDGRGDRASPDDVTDGVRSAEPCAAVYSRPRSRARRDRRPAAGDVELGEDVLGVGAQGVVRDEQLAGDLRARSARCRAAAAPAAPARSAARPAGCPGRGVRGPPRSRRRRGEQASRMAAGDAVGSASRSSSASARPRRGRAGRSPPARAPAQGVGRASPRPASRSRASCASARSMRISRRLPARPTRRRPSPAGPAVRPPGRGRAVRVRPVLGEQQPHEGEVVELAEVADLVGDGHPAVARPVRGPRQVALARSRPGPSSPRWDARPGRSPGGSSSLRLVEQRDGALEVAVGGGEASRGHEPPVAALARRRRLGQRRRRPRGAARRASRSPASRSSSLSADVQVGGRPGRRLAQCLGLAQRPLADVARAVLGPPGDRATCRRARRCC